MRVRSHVGELSHVRCSTAALLLAVSAACGGGGGDGPSTPPPVNNSPASIRLSQTGPISLTSGTTSTVSATVLTSDGREVSGATVTWATSDANVARVQDGTISASKVGSATITASAGSVTSPGLIVNVTPGAPSQIVVRTQPGGAVVAQPLLVQPVVELRDANSNVVTTPGVGVTASLAASAGTLTGTTQVSAVNGAATFSDLAITGVIGPRTLLFSTSGAPTVSSASFDLAIGAPSQLAVTVQPSGAAVAQAFTTQPTVEIQDAGGNRIPDSTLPVTASLESGGGSLSGTTTVSATSGSARFIDLSLVGLVGSRSLRFSASAVVPVTSSPFALRAGKPTALSIVRQPVGGAVAAPLLTQPAVEMRDVSGNVATDATVAVTASLSFGGGVLLGATSIAPSNGVASFTNLSITGSAGDRELTLSAPGTPSVTTSRFPLATLIYGLASEKLQLVDVGDAVIPVSSAGTPPTFASRAPTLAAVDNAGRITARQEGQAWIISSIPLGSDSVMVVVPRAAGGPILRTNLSGSTMTHGSTVTVDLMLDPRTTAVGSVSLFVTANYVSTPFSGVVTAVQPSGVSVSLNQPTLNVFRFNVASASGINAPVTFGRLQFISGGIGETLVINLTAVDAFAPDGSDLRSRITSTYYPMVSK